MGLEMRLLDYSSSNGEEQDSRVTAAEVMIKRDVAELSGNICG